MIRSEDTAPRFKNRRIPIAYDADYDAATQTLRGIIRASTAVIEANRNVLNALNVFPVPDGDTGTNMMLTLRNIEEQMDARRATSFADAVEGMARAALLGARGNSGLILAQLFRGMRIGLKDELGLTGANFAESLTAATDLAYKAVPQPREGTMLTVIRESAEAATQASEQDYVADVATIVRCAADEAMRSVERTPELLDVLKQAGVIDSGGWGLAMMFESMYRYLIGEGEVTIMLDPPATNITATTDFSRTGVTIDRSFVDAIEEEEWGYCTVFAIEGNGLDIAVIQAEMDDIGRSPVIAGDDTLVKVHLHTEDPGQALSAGVKHGALSNIDISNMDAQAAEWSADRRLADSDDDGAAPSNIDIGVLAVVQGDGMSAYFHSVAPGAVSIIQGGDTLNPSVAEILSGIDEVPSDTVIVLPNNKNIIGAAQQASELTRKTVQVIPTTTMQAGIAAVGAFDPEASIDDNGAEMSEMLSDLHVGDVFKSERDAQYGDVNVKRGEYMVRVDGEPVAASDDEVNLLVVGVLSSMHHGASIYVFVGADQDPRRATLANSRLRGATKRWNRVEVNFIDGGQPNYNFLFSIE